MLSNMEEACHMVCLLIVVILALDLILVAVRESVDSGVVEKGLVAIAPGESLRADAQVLVGDERRSRRDKTST